MHDDDTIEPIPLKPKAPESLSSSDAEEAGETAIEEVYRKPALDDGLPKTRFDLPKRRPKPKVIRWPIYVSVLLMILVAVLWFAYLKERTQHRGLPNLEESRSQADPVVLATPEPIESPEEVRLREACLQVQAEYRFARGEWDYRKAAQWSLSAYAEASRLAEQGLDAVEQRAYASASNLYRQAVTTLDGLDDEKPAAVTQLIDRARTAFAARDFPAAEELLELALDLDAEQPFARRLLQRAKAGPQVARLLARGAEHEQTEGWPLAHADYQEAIQLDPESAEAATAFNRVKARIAESAFQALMSEGLSAFSQGDYTNALVTLSKARAYRPESSEVKDALVQVNDAIRLERLARQRKQAEAFEAAEKWGNALEVYMGVLQEDPQVEFARQGRLRATQQIELIKLLRQLVSRPDALLERKGLQYANEVLTEVEALPFSGEKLSRLSEQLNELIRAVRQPIEVTITSDGMTRVSLYRVGQFGTLSVKIVDLTPGKYTVVGARPGYRDVRIDFLLKPGSGPRTVEVVCREKVF